MDIKKIWIKEGYGKDNPLSRSLLYLQNKGKEFRLNQSIVDQVIADTFLQMKKGKKWPLKGPCPCGCDSKKSGTAVIHYMALELRKLAEKETEKQGKIIAERINQTIQQPGKLKKFLTKKIF